MARSERDRAVAPGRKQTIATAAIEVLAAEGSRGLTHRAVDAAAGLRPGAVNYHAPSREKLVRLALDEVFARDFAVAATHFGHLIDGRATSASEVAACVVAFIEEMTTPPSRHRVVARHVLLGEAQRDSDIRSLFDEQRQAFVEFTTRIVGSIGSANPAVAAETAVIVIEGIMQRQVLIGAEPLGSIEAIIERVFGVRGVTE